MQEHISYCSDRLSLSLARVSVDEPTGIEASTVERRFIRVDAFESILGSRGARACQNCFTCGFQ